MKLSKKILQKIIKEEIDNFLLEEKNDNEKIAAMEKLIVLAQRLYNNLDGGDGILSQWGGGQEKATNLAWTKDLVLMLNARLNRIKSGEYGEPPPEQKIDLKRMVNRVLKGMNNFMSAVSFIDSIVGKKENQGLQEKSERHLHRISEDNNETDRTFQRAKSSLVRSFKRIVKKLTWSGSGSAGAGYLTRDGQEGVSELISLIENSEDIKEINTYLRELKDEIMDSSTSSRWIQSGPTRGGMVDSEQYKAWFRFQEQIRQFENLVLDISENSLEDTLGLTERMVAIIRSPELEGVWLKDIEKLLLDVIASISNTERQVAGWQW